jgi:hypothetical protein
MSDHVWFNGVIYSIAKTFEEAEQLAYECLHDLPDFDPEWLQGDNDGWELIEDDRALTLSFNEEDEEETLLASEWAKRFGPGFLALD